MKVLVVSGIWPPDVGGPASHAPEVAAFLRARGHEVEVVITADAEPARRGVPGALGARARCRPASATPRPCGCSPRSRGAPTSSTRPGCSAAPRSARSLGRTPFVTKLTADPAYERARRWGLSDGSLEEFQRDRRRDDAAAAASRATSTCAARRTS